MNIFRFAWMPIVFVTFVALGYIHRTQAQVQKAPQASEESVGTRAERLVIYIGSSTCAASNAEDLPRVWAAVVEQVAASAKRDSRRLVRVGVAKDADVQRGLGHLDKYGSFDEVSTGRGWANLALLKYVYGDLSGPGATPQILVVDRIVHRDTETVFVSDESIRLRRLGLLELRSWAGSGTERSSGNGTPNLPR